MLPPVSKILSEPFTGRLGSMTCCVRDAGGLEKEIILHQRRGRGSVELVVGLVYRSLSPYRREACSV